VTSLLQEVQSDSVGPVQVVHVGLHGEVYPDFGALSSLKNPGGGTQSPPLAGILPVTQVKH